MALFTSGEVANKLGLSVRTLRYYDQIGLVTPYREESGKRLYTEKDMLELEKIILLKKAAFSLKDIENMLTATSVEEVLSIHREMLQKTKEHIQTSLQHTTTIWNSLQVEGKLRYDQLIPLMRSDPTEHNSAIDSNVKQALPKMEEDHSYTQKWINVVKRIEMCLEEGVSPTSKRAQILASDIAILTEEMFNGSKEQAVAFWEVRKSPEHSSQAGLYPLPNEIIHYIEEIFSIYEEETHK
ncbi:MerR family transcriptional regulator [Pontibacillus salicampi]|uniref:MerR family transcriptional regulator n=1 Tax=Pontibacillus salicampi TaxID=1449801 RepID=A0ABV6LPM4_9BACI